MYNDLQMNDQIEVSRLTFSCQLHGYCFYDENNITFINNSDIPKCKNYSNYIIIIFIEHILYTYNITTQNLI